MSHSLSEGVFFHGRCVSFGGKNTKKNTNGQISFKEKNSLAQ
jgi:hypothetical protein